MNEVGVVISRFYEDLKWLEELKSPLDIYVYDRGGVIETINEGKYFHRSKTPLVLNTEVIKNNGVNLQIIDMADDLGFECSTYSYHCYTKYDSLNDFTVFLQGHPQIYCQNIVSDLNDVNKLKHTKRITIDGGWNVTTTVSKKVIEECIEFEYMADSSLGFYFSYDYGWGPYLANVSKSPFWKFCKNMPGWSENRDTPPNTFPFGAGNQFIVSKKLILRHEPDYYKQIQYFTQTHMDPNPTQPDYQQRNQGPNILEAIWQFVF